MVFLSVLVVWDEGSGSDVWGVKIMERNERAGGAGVSCKNHPGVEGIYFCSKLKYYLCHECVRCVDPKIYCKFRTSCVIHFLEKEKRIKNNDSGD